MTRQLLKAAVVALLALIYDYFFWAEQLGLNLVLFSLFIGVAWVVVGSTRVINRYVLLAGTGMLVSSIGVLVFNSTVSIVAHISAVVIMAGFIHRSEFKSVFYAFWEMLLSLFTVFKSVVNLLGGVLNRFSISSNLLKKLFAYIKLAIIPVLIFGLFFVIFSIANPVFGDWTYDTIEWFFDTLFHFLETLSFERFFFIISGLYIAGLLVTGGSNSKILSITDKLDILKRRRDPQPRLNVTPIALKNEYKIALMTIISVNVLFFIVNVIDVRWLWLSGIPDNTDNWSELVHEGTYMLIFSILLSMGILLYYFKGNLNFLQGTKALKMASYVWIGQNAILAVSVGLRSIYYIQVHGLAYKRIGVIIFLILAIIGMVTLFLKIKDLKSAYYLLRVNSWAAFAMLMTMSVINWDSWIVSHNFNHPQVNDGEIDIDYMISRADRTLVLVDKYKDRVDMDKRFNTTYSTRWVPNNDHSRELYFKERKVDFIDEYESTSWLSWNWADQKTYEYFTD